MSQDSPYVIGDVDGFTSQIGRLVSMMKSVRSTTLAAVAGLTVNELDYLHDAQSNSIGALLAHIAAAEVGYQAATLHAREMNEDEMRAWGAAISLGERSRREIRGNDLAYYVQRLEQVRATTLAELGRRDDRWLEAETMLGNGQRVNNYFKWFHVFGHELNHRGQIRWLRARAAAACTVLGVLLMAAGGSAQQPASKPVCWPLHFAGVTVGVNVDGHVRRLLGPGLFRRDAGDSGGRLFIDRRGTATLETANYTDRVVGELTISAGVAMRLTASQRRRATSQFFDPMEGFGNYHALHLGSTREQVLTNLGPPEGLVQSSDWRYSRGCTCELPEFFTISFTDDRITRVVFSAPAG